MYSVKEMNRIENTGNNIVKSKIENVYQAELRDQLPTIKWNPHKLITLIFNWSCDLKLMQFSLNLFYFPIIGKQMIDLHILVYWKLVHIQNDLYNYEAYISN